jgi:hypothetical protein
MADSEALVELAPSLRVLLLAWWEVHGRHDIPWKLRPDGSGPNDGERLCVLSTWSAEQIRADRARLRGANQMANAELKALEVITRRNKN